MAGCVSGAQQARNAERGVREARVKALVGSIAQRDPALADALIDMLFRMVDKK